MTTIKRAALIAICGIGLMACSDKHSQQADEEAAAPAAADPATTVFINGNIITVDEARPRAEALAVRDGKILAVGARGEVEAAAGNNVAWRDLQGHTLASCQRSTTALWARCSTCSRSAVLTATSLPSVFVLG